MGNKREITFASAFLLVIGLPSLFFGIMVVIFPNLIPSLGLAIPSEWQPLVDFMKIGVPIGLLVLGITLTSFGLLAMYNQK